MVLRRKDKDMKRIVTLILSLVIAMQSFSVLAAVGGDTSDTTSVPNWTIRSNNSDSHGYLDMADPVSGKQSLKLVNETPSTQGGYLSASTSVELKSGKDYKVGFVAKGLSVDNATVSLGGLSKSVNNKGSSFGRRVYEFDYKHTGDSGTATMSFTVRGICEGLWIDDIYVKDEDGVNYVQNPQFEDGEGQIEEVKDEIKDDKKEDKKDDKKDDVQKPSQDVHSVDKFTADDIELSFATVGFMPVPKKTLTIDGKLDEWGENDLYAHIPSKPEQSVKYMQTDMDINADVYLSWDEDNLYFAIDVEDDVHYALNSSSYWTADSIQFAVTGVHDGFGNEVGVCMENGEVGLFASFPESVQKRMQIAVERTDTNTCYEIALPWDAIFDERPDEIKFDVLVNDNDSVGRIGGIDFSCGGIHQTKTNPNFMVARMMEDNEDIYAWVEGPEELSLDESYDYSFFLVNRGTEDREVTINIDEVDFSEKVTVPARSGIKKIFPLEFGNSGKRQMVTQLSYGDITYETVKNISVSRSQEQLIAFYEEQHPLLESYISDIDALVYECEARKIPVAYLELGSSLMRRHLEWLELDYKNKDLLEVEYIVGALTSIYQKTMEMGEGYLDGTIDPVYVPQFVSSELEIDGQQFIASVDNDGTIERRPVMFTGYLTWFYLLADDIPNLKKWGTNIVQTEIRGYNLITPPDVNDSWYIAEGISHTMDFTVTDEDAKSGKYSFKFSDPAESWVLNSYKYFYQHVDVEPNTTYYYGLTAKATNAQCQWFTISGVGNRVFANGTYDWTTFGGEYTTGPNETRVTFKFYTEAACDEMYIDDIYVTKAGSTENLLKDPGFESGVSWEDKEYCINKDHVESIKGWFKEAEENDVRIDILLGLHDTPSYLSKYYDELKYTGGGFYKYNLNAEKIKEYYSEAIKAIIPEICNYKSFGSVCLTNEPAFNAADKSVSDFYRQDWIDYLKKEYNNDISYLNRAYGTEYERFEDVPIQSKSYSAQEYDTRDFAGNIFTEWHQWCADEVKKYAPNALVHAKTMQYLYDNDHNVSRSQLGIGTDMAKFTTFSDINGNDAGSGLGEDSMEQLFFRYDYQTSVKNAPVDNSEDHCYGGYSDAFGNKVDIGSDDLSEDLTAKGAQMAMWGGSMHGRGASTIWIFERDKVDARNRDYYNQLIALNPSAMYAVGTAGLDLQRLSYEVAAFQNQPKEVGMLYSNASRVYNIGHMNASSEAYYALMHNGQKIHVVTDLTPTSIQDLKMLVLPQVNNLKPDMLAELKKFVDNGGHLVILDDGNSLKYDHHGLENDAETVNYIMSRASVHKITMDGLLLKNPEADELEDIINAELTTAGINRFKIVNAQTGERMTDLDYYATTYEGDLMVQVCSFNQSTTEPIEMKLLVNGKPVGEFKELVSNKTLTDTFELRCGEYAILRMDTNNKFVDTYGHWAEKFITKMADKGIVSGVSDTMFAPNKKITRAEFTALLVRTLGLSATSASYFTDVKSSDWYASAANTAKEHGILADNGSAFNGNDCISREEMAYMLCKATNAKATDAAINFTDSASVSARYAEAVRAVSSQGIIKGYDDGSFRPQGLLTRSEAVTVLANL